MKLKLNYVLIPLAVILVALLSSYASSLGTMEWYDTLIKPGITPPSNVFGIMWTFIYVCTAISALIIWNSQTEKSTRKTIMCFFICNGVLNALWSVLFFTMHEMGLAFGEMILLNLSVIFIMVASYSISKTATALLVPYLVWALFATLLTYQFIQLNPLYGF